MSTLSKSEIEDIREVFDLFDFWDGRDGMIDAVKVGDLLRCSGINPTIALCVKHGATTKQGEKQYKFDEFLPCYEAILKEKETGTSADYMEAFKTFDREGQGFISAAEMRHILTGYGERLEDEEVDAIVKFIDLHEDLDGNIKYEVKLGLSVRRWSHVSQSLDRQLKRLNRTRSAIEYGQLCLNKGQLFAQADEAPNEDINPATLAARKLLLYLFTTVTKTQELLTLMNKSGHTSRPDDLAIILSYLKLQLESCQMCRSDLEQLICGADAACPEPTMDDSEATDSIDCLQNSSPAPVQVLPVDLIPEDDVVEDVATGHGDQPVGQDQIEALGSSMMPLHASVLNELRLAIAERRVEMQQREHVALQKRLRSSGSPHLTASTTELEQKTTSPVATESSGSQSPGIPISDDTLNRFFSSTTSTSSPRDTDARHGHPWSNRSAVSKRLQAFRRAHPTGDTADRQSGQCTDEHMPNPLSGSSFAASLLAQRRAIGYAEEDSFVAVGDGPEEDLISDVGNPDDGEPMNT